MYLAQPSNTIEIQAPFYINIIENILAKGHFPEKENIDNAIWEAKEIAEDKKDIFQINNKYYFFITTLLNKYKHGLSEINGNEISPKTYSDILGILK